MRPSQVTQALEYLIKAKQPVMLHGSPGVGKSQVVKQVADKLGIEMIDLRLSQLDPVDLRGVPSVDKTKVGKISMKQVEDIAKQKLVDLNSTDLQASMRQVMGTARSMGVEVR